MTEWIRTHKKDLWVNIIVTAITTAFFWLGGNVIRMIPIVGKSLVNVIYYNAGRQSLNTLFSTVLSMCVGTVTGALLTFCFRAVQIAAKRLKELRHASNGKANGKELACVAEEDLTVVAKEKNMISGMKKLRGLAIAVIIMVVLGVGYLLIFEILPLNLRTTFDRQIIQITPYVEKMEIDMLRSKWVSMRTKSDYDEINEEIKKIMEENDLP